MSNSPGIKKVPPRPKITLPIPGQYGRYPQTPAGYVSTPYNQTPAPMTPVPVTPVSGQPQVFYSNRASEFVFTQFKGIKDFTKSGLSVGERSVFWLYEKVSSWSKRWFTHIFLVVIVFLYSVAGAMIFITIEGTNEDIFHLNIRQERNKTIELIRELWDDEVLASDVELWKGGARRELMKYEEHLYEFYKLGVIDRGEKVWTFWNAVFYCGTIYTTIGYGHISPSTTTGRAITIVYAIFGIPMFLILLADFGKLFTRGIKFLWAFVRRLYYTGSCRKVRRTVPVQEVMKGVQLVYDLATFRRPSQMNPEDIEEIQKQQNQQAVLNIDGNAPDTPGTPAMSTFAIDDEFNLPISVAIFILLGYIFIGATLYNAWEEWGFFESFYFVFISMSTIGFGDYVPKHPMYMMCSIIYLVFGLALTSMCINVVQVMLSDSFKQASQKIGATIGFEIADDDGSVKPAPPPPVEVADIHTSIKDSESVEKIAPKAKQEDVDL